MKWILFCLAFAIPMLAHAQVDPVAAVGATEAMVDVPAEVPTVDELLGQTGEVINDWRALGWLAGLIALVNLLINLLRLPLIGTLLQRYKKKWMKPYIAAGLGAVLAGFTTYVTNANVVNSIVMGLIAGFAAIGVHEAANKRKAKNRDA